jgi:hypothetical protein
MASADCRCARRQAIRIAAQSFRSRDFRLPVTRLSRFAGRRPSRILRAAVVVVRRLLLGEVLPADESAHMVLDFIEIATSHNTGRTRSPPGRGLWPSVGPCKRGGARL